MASRKDKNWTFIKNKEVKKNKVNTIFSLFIIITIFFSSHTVNIAFVFPRQMCKSEYCSKKDKYNLYGF